MGENINNIGGYPSPLKTSKEKLKAEYGLKYAMAMYRDWAGDSESIANRNRARYKKARNYRNGTQSASQYLDQLDMGGDKSWININKSIVPIIPKFIDVIVDGMMSLEYDIDVDAFDNTAVSERNEVRRKLISEINKRDFIKEFRQVNEIESNQKPSPIEYEGNVFETEDEVELFMSMFFKQAVEVAMQVGLKHTFMQNDFEEIKRQLLEDLACCDIAATRTHLDPYDGVKIRRVDPENLVYSYTSNPSFKDITHAGEVVIRTIGQLKRMFPDNGLTEQDWEELARTAGKSNNPDRLSNSGYYQSNFSYDEYIYDHDQVTCLDFEFLSTDKVVYEKKHNKYGTFKMYEKDDSYSIPKNAKYKREKVESQVKNVYGGLWVIGQKDKKFLFGYGKKKNMNRPNHNLADARISFSIYAPNIYKKGNLSIVERMIPLADEIQITHLKLQQVIAKARPNGLMIDIDGLTDINLDGGEKAWSPLELIKVYDQTGNMYFSRIDDEGNATGRPPMNEINNGISIQGVQSLITAYNFFLSQIRDVTGVNEVRDASQPSSEALVGVQKLALAASNNATKFIHNGWVNITNRTATISADFIQDIISNDKNFFNDAIGSLNDKTIESIGRIPLHFFSIFINVAPMAEEKMLLEGDIRASVANGELRLEDAILIRNIKDVKAATQMLVSRRKKYQREKAEADRANMEYQAQINQQSAQTASQLRMQEIEGQIQVKLAQIDAESRARLQELELEYMKKAELSMQEYKQNMDIHGLKKQAENYMMNRKQDREDNRLKETKTYESRLIEQRKKDLSPQDFTDPLKAIPNADN